MIINSSLTHWGIPHSHSGWFSWYIYGKPQNYGGTSHPATTKIRPSILNRSSCQLLVFRRNIYLLFGGRYSAAKGQYETWISSIWNMNFFVDLDEDWTRLDLWEDFFWCYQTRVAQTHQNDRSKVGNGSKMFLSFRRGMKVSLDNSPGWQGVESFWSTLW